MNFKTTLVLVVLLAIVGAYVFFIGRSATPTYEIEEAERAAGTQQGQPLFGGDALTPADVTRVTIARGDESATFEKIDGTWRQVEPAEFRADGTKLDGLVRSAAGLRYVDRVRAGASGQPSRADLALEPARATVTLTAGDEEHTIAVGRRSTGGRGYVAVGDSGDVYVVEDALQSVLFTPDRLTSWRHKALSPPAASELDEVVIASGDSRVTVSKRDGRWYLGEGTGERASESALADLVRNLGYLSAREFVSDAPEALPTFGVAEPRTTIRLRQAAADESDPARVSTLRVGNAADAKEETVYATWTQGPEDAPPSGVVFTLTKATVDGLVKELDDLRDPSLVTAKNAADVVSVTVTPAEGDAVQLRRDGGGWRFADPGPGFEPEAAAVDELVNVVLRAEGERFEPAPADAEPVATVALGIAGRDQPETVRLYPADGDEGDTHLAAVREDERVAAVLPTEDLERVLVPAAALREKTVLRIEPGAVTAATLEQPEGATYRFTRADGEGQWSLEGARAFESADLDLLIDEVTRLRAESWVTDGRSVGGTPIVLTLRLADGERTLRVDPASRVAQLDGLDTPFMVQPVLVDLLSQEYRDRTAIELTNEEIRQVTLTRGEETVTIRRGDDGRFTMDAGAGAGEAEGEAAADQAQAATVFDTLAGLRVERWLDEAGESRPAGGMIRVELTPASGETRELTLSTEDGSGTLGEGGAARGFLLDRADVSRIVAPIAPEEAAKAEAADGAFIK